MKDFMRKYNISQSCNGKPCYLSVAKFQQGQEREGLQGVFFDEDKGVFFDEDNLVIWAYNQSGWNDLSEATDFVIQSLLTSLPVARRVPESRPQQTPIRLARNSVSEQTTTKQSVQRQRENSWQTPQVEQGVQANIPKRKKRVPRPDPTMSMQGQSTAKIEREPARKEVMEYLKNCFMNS